jgi:hypothetical protein
MNPALWAGFFCYKLDSIESIHFYKIQIMNSYSTAAKDQNAIITKTAFYSLQMIENGLVLKNKKKEEITLFYAELCKTYIKKNRISFVKKIGILSFLLVLVPILDSILPYEFVVFSLGIGSIPLLVKLNIHTSYQLVLLHQNGTVYKKKFGKNTKQEYNNKVNLIRKEIYDATVVNQDFQSKNPIEELEVLHQEQVYASLSIA